MAGVTVGNLTIKVQSGTTSTLYATWDKPNKSNIDHYNVKWGYKNSGEWFNENVEETTSKKSTYSYPDNATSVRVQVKPVSKTKSNGKKYWTGEWSTATYADVSTNGVPEGLSAPSIEVGSDGQTITLSYTSITDSNAKQVQFKLYRSDNSVAINQTITVSYGAASVSKTCAKGYQYRGQARAYNNSIAEYGEWSDYTDWVETESETPSWIMYYASDDDEVYLKWSQSSTAETYKIQAATKIAYLTSSSGDAQSVETEDNSNYYYWTLTSGSTYYFRVCAVNSAGVESDWSDIVYVTLGTDAEAPTTWSSSTTVIVGEDLFLYWIHNCADGSLEFETYVAYSTDGGSTYDQYYRILEDGSLSVYGSFDVADENGDSSSLTFDTSSYSEGTTLLWKVRTAGCNHVLSDWSMVRSVNIYAEPSVSISISDGTTESTKTSSTSTSLNFSTGDIESLTSFPIYVTADTAPDTQSPVGFNVVITAFETYETTDLYGDDKTVFAGDEIYSEYFSTSDPLDLTLTPSDVDFEGGAYYKITVTAAMNSGLTATVSITFGIDWEDEDLEVEAIIYVHEENGYTAEITPLCYDEDGDDYTDVYFNIYRRDFDGGYTAIETEIESGNTVTVVDPHPALDCARYRVIAVSTDTGAMSYSDLDSDDIDCPYVIIQWDEDWKTLNVDPDITDDLASSAWEGSLLELKYNIDISDNYDPESTLVEYIGRDYPVGYYGTQRGHTATWSMDVPDTDTETLYGLRRLGIYMGDVYVREPSGSGYWANVKVSFSQTHCERNIPVTLELTRVEGDA